MTHSLNGKRVAILVTEGFEQVELTGPQEALEKAGATAQIVSAKNGEVTGWNHTTPASKFHVDKTFDDLDMNDYDAVLLPGGVVNSDTIRTDESAQKLVRDAGEQADRGDLSRRLAADLGRTGQGQTHDQLAIAYRRPEERRRRLGGPGGGGGRSTDQQPQAR